MISGHVRPDGRCHVRPDGKWTAEGASAALDLARARGVRVITTVGADDHSARKILVDAGFAAIREEAVVELSLDRAVEVLGSTVTPHGFSLRSAADVDVDRLRVLDDELRNDVPGTSGWRSSAAAFHENTFQDPAFDSATYLIAVDDRSGDYVGLVRVWMNPEMPRIGLIGVRAAYRRRGIASTLLHEALVAVRSTGAAWATTAFDVSNNASRTLFERMGAEKVGATLEFVYPP